MSALQASLLCRPSYFPLLFPPPKPSPSIRGAGHLSSVALRSHRRLALSASRALSHDSPDKDPILDPRNPQNSDLFQEAGVEISRSEEPAVAAVDGVAEESSVAAERQIESRLPLLALLTGVLESVRRGFDRLSMSEWLSWWPFRQEKRLERLIAEADANPKDAAKQSALLAELNKHSPESVIRRFEQRSHAVDSKGVAEYLRALVITNALAEYLPDEHSGKPSSLPTLVVLSFQVPVESFHTLD